MSTSRSNRQLLGTIVYLVIYMVTIVWLQSVKGLDARDMIHHAATAADRPFVGSCDNNQEAISSTMDVNLDTSDLLLPPEKELFDGDFDSSDILFTSGADSQLTVPYFVMSALAIGFVVL